MRPKIGHTALVWSFDDVEGVEHAIRKTGELGFEGTEMWGGLYDRLAASERTQLGDLLEAAGITLASLFHFGDRTNSAFAPELVETARRWADAVAELGGDILMLVPGVRERERYGADDYAVMAQAMNQCGEVARRAGLRAAMDPHWGTTVESESEIDALLALLDRSLVGFAPDSGQIAKGGGDPAAVARRHADRIWHVHLKDLSPTWPELRDTGVPLDSPQGYAELGEGTCDLRGFVAVLEEADFGGWLLAELDETRYTPDVSATINRDFIWNELGLSPSAFGRT